MIKRTMVKMSCNSFLLFDEFTLSLFLNLLIFVLILTTASADYLNITLHFSADLQFILGTATSQYYRFPYQYPFKYIDYVADSISVRHTAFNSD